MMNQKHNMPGDDKCLAPFHKIISSFPLIHTATTNLIILPAAELKHEIISHQMSAWIKLSLLDPMEPTSQAVFWYHPLWIGGTAVC